MTDIASLISAEESARIAADTRLAELRQAELLAALAADVMLSESISSVRSGSGETRLLTYLTTEERQALADALTRASDDLVTPPET